MYIDDDFTKSNRDKVKKIKPGEIPGYYNI